ncbi:Uncharacterized protein PPKH_2978 [Pseudomonas putida]|nr:Uncharacterized protein PPKH_2978 [Pseudomonas putida]
MAKQTLRATQPKRGARLCTESGRLRSPVRGTVALAFTRRVAPWGCCATHRGHASAYSDRAQFKPCAVTVEAGWPAKGPQGGPVRDYF